MGSPDLTQLPPYQYLALPTGSTRIIELFSGSHESPLVGTLRDIPLFGNHEPYQALSYCWGSTALQDMISCDGGAMSITANLSNTLRRLRSPDKSMVLWIDALSINQSKDAKALEERAQQVALMSDIFAKASRVIIDLGPTTQTFEHLVSWLQHYDSLTDEEFEGLSDTDICIPSTGKSDLQDLQLFKEAIDLIQLPWFTRLWCFQEYLLARNTATLIGPRLVDHFDVHGSIIRVTGRLRLAMLGTVMSDFFQELGPGLDGVKRSFEVAHRRDYLRSMLHHDQRTSLEAILTTARNLGVTDPRDRIYAIHALLPDDIISGLRIDYTEPLKALQVRVSLHLIERKFGTWTLMNALGPSPDLPSWAMYLRAQGGEPHRNQTLALMANSTEDFAPDPDDESFMAGGSTACTLKTSSNSDIVEIEGCIFDSIVSVSEPILPSTGVDAITLGATVVESMIKVWQWADDLNIPEQTLWKVIMFHDHEEERLKADDDHEDQKPSSFGASYQGFKKAVQAMTDDSDEVEDPDLILSVVPFAQRLWMCMPDLSLALTAKGNLAAVRHTAQVGDHIAVLSGVNCPFVLRKQAGQYQIVAPSYLQGYMYGQALEDKTWRTEVLSLI